MIASSYRNPFFGEVEEDIMGRYDMNFTTTQAKEMELAGKKLRMERLRRGLTQTDMGELLGLSTSYISSLERGKRRLSWNVSRKLNQCFGMSYDYMMEPSPDDSAFYPYSDLLADSGSTELEHRFHVLIGTCSDLELRSCYLMCKNYISSSRKEYAIRSGSERISRNDALPSTRSDPQSVHL